MKKKETNPWLVLFDTLFVMLLCFAILLSTMIFKDKSNTGINYLLDLPTIGLTFGALVIYFAYLLPRSDKGLKLTIRDLYKNVPTDQT